MRSVTGILATAMVNIILGGEPAKAGYTTLAPPGATSTEAMGVSGGSVVGSYVSGGTQYGFLYNGTTYTTLALPGALSTVATGVSGGNVVGYYGNSTTNYGFLYNGTTYTTLAPPGATYTEATGVSGGSVVGYYVSGGTGYGFLYNGTTYTTLARPGHIHLCNGRLRRQRCRVLSERLVPTTASCTTGDLHHPRTARGL